MAVIEYFRAMTATSNNDRESHPSAVVLMPAFNEAGAIGQVIADIQAFIDLPIIVIDDASTDDTIGEARRAGATVLPLCTQLGAWGATQTGLRYAVRHGFDVAITMDADGQHDARSLDKLIRPVAQGLCDVSIGACTRRGSALRHVAWVLMKRTSGLALEDITSGFRVYNRQAIRQLASWRASLLDYQDVGVLLLLQAQGLRIMDVKVAMQARQNGKSRIFHSWLTVFYYMYHTLLLGLSKRKRARKYMNPSEITG